MSERLRLGTADATDRVARLSLDLLAERARQWTERHDGQGVERALTAVVNFKVNCAVQQG